MTTYRVLASWTGFCASCPAEQPLLLVSTGPHGLRGWLSGAGPDDRELSYACAVCGRVEHVPATEQEDVAYDASLTRWPDWVEDEVLVVATPAVPVELVTDDVFALAAVSLSYAQLEVAPVPVAVAAPVVVPAPRSGMVRVASMPMQRVSATDLVLLAA